MKGSRGPRASTRRKLSKRFSEKKFTITPYLQEFKAEDRVIVKIDPSSQKGMPHHRFKGLGGVVREKRGDAFVVDVKIGNATKTVISRPEHLRLQK